jgi:hypothetical protein
MCARRRRKDAPELFPAIVVFDATFSAFTMRSILVVDHQHRHRASKSLTGIENKAIIDDEIGRNPRKEHARWSSQEVRRLALKAVGL